jgi:putative ABC transport system permease protein
MDDIRAALRVCRTQPGFAAAVTLTFGIGLSATAVLFSLVHALLLRPLPFPDAHRLVTVEAVIGADAGPLALRELRDLGRESRTVASWGAYYRSQYNVTGGGPPASLTCTIGSASLFRTLGVTPALGEIWPEALDFTRQWYVVLSHRVWQERFGGRPDVIGATITMDRAPYRVAAVLPAGFDYPLRTDVYRAVTDYNADHVRHYAVVARLGPGVSVPEAQAELDALSRRFAERYPATNQGVRLRVTPLRDAFVGAARPYLWLLLAASGLLLAIAAVNVTNLLLARAVAQRGDAAIRLALGASRARLVREALVQALVLATAGSVLALVAARWLLQAVATLVAADLPPWFGVRLDVATFLGAMGAAWTAAALAAILPAILTARGRAERVLRQDGPRAIDSPRRRLARRGLLAGQAAFAALLLVAAGTFAVALRDQLAVDPGFAAERLLTFRVDPPYTRYPDIATTSEFYRRLTEALVAVPGVTAAATASTLPLMPEAPATRRIHVDGRSSGRADEDPFATIHLVSPSYFATLGIALRRGRAFAWTDRESAPPVGIVSERTARRLWGAADPIGRRLRFAWNQHGTSAGGGEDVWLTIVGVAADTRGRGVDDTASLHVYAPSPQFYAGDAYVAVRTAVTPGSIVPRLRAAIDQVDPEQSYFAARPMTDVRREAAWTHRVASVVLGVLAAIALALAAIGAYAVTAHAVAAQRREIGLRLAIGAPARRTAALILGRAIGPILAGCAAGGIAGLLTARLLAPSMGIALDGVALALPAALPLVLIAAAATACAWPIARTMRRIALADALRAGVLAAGLLGLTPAAAAAQPQRPDQPASVDVVRAPGRAGADDLGGLSRVRPLIGVAGPFDGASRPFTRSLVRGRRRLRWNAGACRACPPSPFASWSPTTSVRPVCS